MKKNACFGKVYYNNFYYEANSLIALNTKIMGVEVVHFQKSIIFQNIILRIKGSY